LALRGDDNQFGPSGVFRISFTPTYPAVGRSDPNGSRGGGECAEGDQFVGDLMARSR